MCRLVAHSRRAFPSRCDRSIRDETSETTTRRTDAGLMRAPGTDCEALPPGPSTHSGETLHATFAHEAAGFRIYKGPARSLEPVGVRSRASAALRAVQVPATHRLDK